MVRSCEEGLAAGPGRRRRHSRFHGKRTEPNERSGVGVRFCNAVNEIMLTALKS